MNYKEVPKAALSFGPFLFLVQNGKKETWHDLNGVLRDNHWSERFLKHLSFRLNNVLFRSC